MSKQLVERLRRAALEHGTTRALLLEAAKTLESNDATIGQARNALLWHNERAGHTAALAALAEYCK